MARFILLLTLLVEVARIQGQPSKAPALQPSVAHYDLNITVDLRSPDCFLRPVILVNGKFFNTTLEVVQGQILEVAVTNNIPDSFPEVSDGISIHWHGLNQKGSEWMDGVAYITQCPIAQGSSFTYRFQVNDVPGTYLWHGHAGVERVDGLQGALIVRPQGADPLASLYDEERIITLDDWYHDLYAELTFATSRPFDDSKVTQSSGSRVWVDNPQSILINGQGYYDDCKLRQGGTSQPISCNVTQTSIPPGRSLANPQAGQANQGCTHYNLTVEAGKRYRLRVINFSSLVMLTFSVEGHKLDIIAADATPTELLSVDSLDVNSGQRYDVILTANAAEPRSYYITAQSQYRDGSPAGFGFLLYSNSNVSALPPTPTPSSNATLPWTLAQVNAVKTANGLVNGTSTALLDAYKQDNISTLAVPGNVSVNVFFNITQPVLSRGQLHWALNNVASYRTPGCTALLSDLYDERTRYLSSQEVEPGNNTVDYSLQQSASSAEKPQIYVYGESVEPLASPVTGQYIVDLQLGDTVEVVVQNLPGNASGGDDYLVKAAPSLLAGRSAQEQHPFHLHGHHFYVVATGNGTWTESSISTYNLENPIFRDVVTLPKNGWVALRFIADNPGTWTFHCHFSVHLYMGQDLVFAEAVDQISAPPAEMPTCPESCTANFAGWALDYVAAKYGDSGFQ